MNKQQDWESIRVLINEATEYNRNNTYLKEGKCWESMNDPIT